MLAFSTCWNSERAQTGEEMLEEILDLGFDNVELGHGVRVSLFHGILKFAESGRIKITSLHNYCPLPVEIQKPSPNCYEFTSHRAHDRERAHRLTKQTIDYAAKLGAVSVVMHLGSVRTLHVTDQLWKLLKEGHYLSKEYARIKLEGVIKRERASAHYLARVYEYLAPLLEYAAAKDVQLAVENRDRYEDIPSEREFPSLFERFQTPYLGYWHDFGHAQLKENLALMNHREWLAEIGSKTFGCHLHDASWPNRDHKPPFEGEIKFEQLVPFLPKNTPFILEMNPRVSAESIRLAAERWQRVFDS